MEKMWYTIKVKGKEQRGEKRWKEDKFLSIYLSIYRLFLFNISRGKGYQRADMKGVSTLFLCSEIKGIVERRLRSGD